MARNTRYDDGWDLEVPVASGTVSGDPVVVGQLPGVAQTDRDSDGDAAVTFKGVHMLEVEAVNNAGNSAVAVGDIIYYEAGETPPLNKDSVAGVRFGYALGTVTAGETAEIAVKVGY